MTQANKGWNQNLMMSLFGKEAEYDAGVTISAATACSMVGYEFEPSWPDKIENDKGDVTGKEHGYDQEIIQYGFEATYKESKAKPNSVIGLAALVLGAVSNSQDGELTAYKHIVTPVPIGTGLPSMHVEHVKGGLQYKYTGVKGNSYKLSGEAGAPLSLEVALLGSGTRATSATEFVAAITESWLLLSKMSVWMETGANISITAAAPARRARRISPPPLLTPWARVSRNLISRGTTMAQASPEPEATGFFRISITAAGRRN